MQEWGQERWGCQILEPPTFTIATERGHVRNLADLFSEKVFVSQERVSGFPEKG